MNKYQIQSFKILEDICGQKTQNLKPQKVEIEFQSSLGTKYWEDDSIHLVDSEKL